MKLALIYLIKGPAEKYHQKLVKEVGPKFGEMHVTEGSLPTHVTLKSPFNTRSLKNVERAIESVASKHNKSKITVGGFGHFRRFVAFMKVNLTKKEKAIQKELIQELKKIGIESHEFDIQFKPHATISYGNKPETFDKIWIYLGKKKPRKFNIYFDNVSILKKFGKNDWRVYKEFKLK